MYKKYLKFKKDKAIIYRDVQITPNKNLKFRIKKNNGNQGFYFINLMKTRFQLVAIGHTYEELKKDFISEIYYHYLFFVLDGDEKAMTKDAIKLKNKMIKSFYFQQLKK